MKKCQRAVIRKYLGSAQLLPSSRVLGWSSHTPTIPLLGEKRRVIGSWQGHKGLSMSPARQVSPRSGHQQWFALVASPTVPWPFSLSALHLLIVI